MRLNDLVSMDPFRENNLKPGMTATEVAAILGRPDYLHGGRQGGDEIFGFQTDDGDFEVLKQHVSSEGVEVDPWFLRYRPRDCASLVNPRLLKQIQNLEPRPREVTVFSGFDRRGKAIIELDEVQACSAIWWLQKMASRLSDAPAG